MGRKKKPAAGSNANSSPRPAIYDIDYLKSICRGQWVRILSQVFGLDPAILDGQHHPCPKCGGTDRFRLVDAEAGAVICNQCARTGIGDGFAAGGWASGKKFAEVLALVADYLGVEPTAGTTNYRGKSDGKSRDKADPAEHLKFDDKPVVEDLRVATWCLWKAPITPEAIAAVGGRVARYRERHSVIAIPVWGADICRDVANPDAKPCGWLLYNLCGGTLPKFTRPANPGDKWGVEDVKVKLTYGSKPGIIADRARLASATTIWKTEGPSDLLGLLSLADLPADVAALTNANGAGETPAAWMLDLFAGKSALVVHDADEPGQRGAAGWVDEAHGRSSRPHIGWAPAIASKSTECRNVVLPFDIQPNHGKDLRDYLTEPPAVSYADLADLASLFPAVEPASAELLATVDKSTPAAPAVADGGNSDADKSDGSSLPVVRADMPLEEDDDPHRLARVNLETYANHREGGTLRFWRDEWWTWTKERGSYRRIKETDLRARISASIRKEYERIWREDFAEYESWRKSAGYDPDQDKGPPKVRKVTKAMVTNVLEATASMVVISSSVEQSTWIDGEDDRERKSYIAMRNGILDIEAVLADRELSECLLPHSEKWFSPVCLPYIFDPEATCPKWEKVLERNLDYDPEKIKILQEWAGYLLLPDTGEQKFLVLEGEGRNGKSVYCAAIRAMLGGEANCSSMPLELLADRFAKTETLGKLVNVSADVGELDKVAEGYLKSFTSGDVMFFDRKGISGINCSPTARLMMACNNRPRFGDRSDGIWRRMIPIRWEVQITDQERIKNMDKEWWWERSGELPGIFNWALQGLARLRGQNGFTESKDVSDTLEDYRLEVNPTRVFLKENLEFIDPKSSDCPPPVRSIFVYALYSKWMNQHGNKPLGERLFGKEVKRCFKESNKRYLGSRGDRYWVYDGLRFTVDEIAGEKTFEGSLF